MAVEGTSQWLVTGDVDGLIKMWNISEYCIKAADDIITDTPRMYRGLRSQGEGVIIFYIIYVSHINYYILL